MRANALGCTCEVELGRYVQHSHRSKLVKIGAVRRAGVGPDRSRARAWTKCRALGRRQQPQPRLQTLCLAPIGHAPVPAAHSSLRSEECQSVRGRAVRRRPFVNSSSPAAPKGVHTRGWGTTAACRGACTSRSWRQTASGPNTGAQYPRPAPRAPRAALCCNLAEQKRCARTCCRG